MTKILLALTFAFIGAQAENIVHYDTKTVKKPAISKPNHPTADLYTK
jgi:CRISPR/Cas system CMR-associated protein Cmr5 small subunit